MLRGDSGRWTYTVGALPLQGPGGRGYGDGGEGGDEEGGDTHFCGMELGINSDSGQRLNNVWIDRYTSE